VRAGSSSLSLSPIRHRAMRGRFWARRAIFKFERPAPKGALEPDRLALIRFTPTTTHRDADSIRNSILANRNGATVRLSDVCGKVLGHGRTAPRGKIRHLRTVQRTPAVFVPGSTPQPGQCHRKPSNAVSQPNFRAEEQGSTQDRLIVNSKPHITIPRSLRARW